MSTLDRALRKKLAETIIAAREVAEEAAADAVRRLGVIDDEAPNYLTADQKALRVRLRAHARALGDRWNAEKKKLLSTKHLETEAAYEIWHRMLFGRFLVERELLLHPEFGVPIVASQLADLAQEAGVSDPWILVERFAAPAMPAVFKPNDPVLAMTLDPASAKRLRDLVAGLPAEVFAADDSLGWTYQFWQTAEKDAVNKAGGKVGAAELPAVTQLFTESYMVQFLLHNTLGAWWAGKVLAASPYLARDATDEQTLRAACALPNVGWEFLRFVRDGDGTGPWRPAAGSFPGWPLCAAEITFLDPCCGSGHFLVEAFAILAVLRQREEGLSGEDAARVVLRNNLHGLELDGRCVQIAAFNVALTAWKIAGGPVELPQPQIAWVGAPPPMSRAEMAGLGNGDAKLRQAMESLYDQFVRAPLLGSLLEVGASDLLDADLREHGELVLSRLREAEPERIEGAVAARGLLDATGLLAKRYVLQATNVPFLGRGRQTPTLTAYIEQRFASAKADLATAMLERMRGLAALDGAIASVTPQNWLFLGSYKKMREEILRGTTLSLVAGLGPRAFETISGEIVNTALITMRNTVPTSKTTFAGLDANNGLDANSKKSHLAGSPIVLLKQCRQMTNPDWRITVHNYSDAPILEKFAKASQGITSGDNDRYRRVFWEQPLPRRGWVLFQSTVEAVEHFGGRHLALLWGDDGRHIARPQGVAAWGKTGIAISQMGALAATIASGEKFDMNGSVLVPTDPSDMAALWTFCSSADFPVAVRRIDQAIKVTTGTLTKVPFDLAYWKQVAGERYPEGLPEPYSDDPTQWIFHGHPAHAMLGTELHVALARLAGYRWPAETDPAMRLAPLAHRHIAAAATLPGADADGLLPLHATAQDRALADRLRDLLAAAYGDGWTNALEQALVRAADALLDKKETKDVSLESWLRDRAFRQHCTLFHQRPFLWQIWDVGKGGFSAFVHYHRLGHATLEKLTYTVLGDWTARMRAEGRAAEEGWALQLRQRLVTILDGEDAYDVFVRWKPLDRQPVGWDPDLDDGVRLNIRPFMRAGVLREQPKGIAWGKDRGTDVSSAPWYHLGPVYGGKAGDRINDHHLTLAEKRAAQPMAKVS